MYVCNEYYFFYIFRLKAPWNDFIYYLDNPDPDCLLLPHYGRHILGGAGRLLLLHLQRTHGLGNCSGGGRYFWIWFFKFSIVLLGTRRIPSGDHVCTRGNFVGHFSCRGNNLLAWSLGFCSWRWQKLLCDSVTLLWEEICIKSCELPAIIKLVIPSILAFLPFSFIQLLKLISWLIHWSTEPMGVHCTYNLPLFAIGVDWGFLGSINIHVDKIGNSQSMSSSRER